MKVSPIMMLALAADAGDKKVINITEIDQTETEV